MATIRTRDDIAVCAVFDHNIQANRTVSPGQLFEANDPFVKQIAWAFGDGSSGVERATAAPGEKRAIKRADRKSD